MKISVRFTAAVHTLLCIQYFKVEPPPSVTVEKRRVLHFTVR